MLTFRQIRKKWSNKIIAFLRGQWFTAITVCLTSVTVGQAFAWPSPALPKIRDGTAGFTLSDDDIAHVLVMLYVGCLVSPILGGYIMDVIGRKMTCVVFSAIHLGSWGILAGSSKMYSLAIARFFHGVWCSIVLTVMPAYLSETMEPKYRGSVGALFGVGVFLGSFYESLAGIINDYHWLNGLNILIAVIMTMCLCIIPQSPYYNLMRNDFETAKKNTMLLHGFVDESRLRIIGEDIRKAMENRGSLKDLCQNRETRHAFFMVAVLLVVQRGAGMSLLMTYTSLIVPNSVIRGNNNFILLSLAWIASGFTACYIVRICNRRPLMIVSCTVVGLMSCIVGIWLYLDMTKIIVDKYRWVPLIALLIHAAFYGCGVGPIPLLIQGELFPVNVKGLASALVSMISAITSGAIVEIFFPLTNHFGMYSNFIIPFVAPWIGALYVHLYMIETRDKTLEEIQAILHKK